MLDSSWKEILLDEFQKPYFLELKKFLIQEEKNHTIYPKKRDIFKAFNTTTFDKLKVVILGQDPYHGQNQAHGLAFSVNDGISHPPSLKNIFKELKDDIGCDVPKSGNLTSWATQGVFLINTVLTVRASEANSHKDRGWEKFIDNVIKMISDKKSNVVFILWGKPAQLKSKLIDTNKHMILNAPHPSPLSSYRGFFGSKPFSKTNEYLLKHGLKEIEWCISNTPPSIQRWWGTRISSF